jgi:hypothetical protein
MDESGGAGGGGGGNCVSLCMVSGIYLYVGGKGEQASFCLGRLLSPSSLCTPLSLPSNSQIARRLVQLMGPVRSRQRYQCIVYVGLYCSPIGLYSPIYIGHCYLSSIA